MAKARRGRKPARRSTGGTGGGMREHWRADGQPKTSYGSSDDANRYASRPSSRTGSSSTPTSAASAAVALGNRRD